MRIILAIQIVSTEVSVLVYIGVVFILVLAIGPILKEGFKAKKDLEGTLKMSLPLEWKIVAGGAKPSILPNYEILIKYIIGYLFMRPLAVSVCADGQKWYYYSPDVGRLFRGRCSNTFTYISTADSLPNLNILIRSADTLKWYEESDVDHLGNPRWQFVTENMESAWKMYEPLSNVSRNDADRLYRELAKCKFIVAFMLHEKMFACISRCGIRDPAIKQFKTFLDEATCIEKLLAAIIDE